MVALCACLAEHPKVEGDLQENFKQLVEDLVELSPTDLGYLIHVCRINTAFKGGAKLTLRLSLDATDNFPHLRRQLITAVTQTGGERKGGLAPRSNAHRMLLEAMGRIRATR